MSITLFRTLLAVNDHGSFSAAAQAINLTQAAVGQQMKRLESQLGVVLFDRQGYVPRLNPLAMSLVPKARELISQYDTLLCELTNDTYLEGDFSVGAVPSTIRALVPLCLKQLRQRAPLLHIRVVPGLSIDIHEQVERGMIDLAILSQPVHIDSSLRWQAFAQEPLVLLVASGLVGDDPLDLLSRMPYIRHTRRAAVGQMADQWLADHEIMVEADMEMESLESVASMVSHNLGVSIVPDICVPDAIFAGLRKLPLPGAQVIRTLGLLSRSDVRQQMLVDVFYQEIRATVETHQLGSHSG